jgi:hypothetical protein
MSGPALITRTSEAALSKARAQDVLYFFGVLSQNFCVRRALRDFFEVNYDTGACAFGGKEARAGVGARYRFTTASRTQSRPRTLWR